MSATKIRNDGKPARTPRLGTPTSSLVPVSKLAEGETPPFWTDLIQPPGTHNRANKAETLRRREAHGQVRPDTAEQFVTNTGPNRAQRRQVHGRGWQPGRLVLHGSRMSAYGDDTPRASVIARRLRRAA